MTVWALLRQLIVHVCHGRGRDTVYVGVNWDTPDGLECLNAVAEEFTWDSNRDASCNLTGTSPTAPRT